MPEGILPSGGVFAGNRHLFPVRIYYEDTDLSGIVYHANYIRYMERARSDMIGLLGADQRAAQETAVGTYAVTDLAIRYVRPARLNDALTVETTVVQLGAATISLRQTITANGQLLTDGTVRVGFVGPDGRPKRQPAAWLERFRTILSPANMQG